ncbi:MAG TPA: hypothetical protein VJ866_19890 [Pyrinomonadaceae bacterium]|nr:hypothetical protein [Pyrinomonadaceae bacterium]
MEAVIGSVIGALVGGAISAIVSYAIFVRLQNLKEQRKQALDLLTKFMTDEYYVKARLVSQEYLLPRGAKYSVFEGMNFEQIAFHLSSSDDPKDREARFYIRAIPSFFWLVDQARENGNIHPKEKLFSLMYSWYWVHIIESRIKGCDHSTQFREFEWMKMPGDEKRIRNDHERISSMINEQKKKAAQELPRG